MENLKEDPLQKKIRRLRKKLDKLVENSLLSTDEILKVSEELDQVITEYYQSAAQNESKQ